MKKHTSGNLARGGFLVATLVLAGCGGQGDFGRDNSSLLATRMGMNAYTPASGYLFAHESQAPFTSAETDLRLLADALSYSYAHRKTHGNYGASMPIVPRKLRAASKSRVTAKGYIEEINRIGHSSAMARLNAITDDMRADGRNIDDFWSATVTVYNTDSTRIREIDAGGVRSEVASKIMQRIGENRTTIDLVVMALGERQEGYRMAIAESYIADPNGGYAGAKLEYDALRRQIRSFDSNLKGLGTRHALSHRRTDGCVTQSLARAC